MILIVYLQAGEPSFLVRIPSLSVPAEGLQSDPPLVWLSSLSDSAKMVMSFV